jgi:uncharacterized protein
MKTIRIAIAVLLVLAVAALAGVGRPEAAESASDDPRAGITVTGSGESRRIPDRAQIMFGVQTHGATADATQTAHAAEVKRLIAALKAAGVAAKDLKTEHFDVSPRYDVDKVDKPEGYQANSSVTVTDQPLDRASQLSDVGVKAGADSVSGPGLSTADPDAGYDKALERAFADARAKAEVLAKAADVSVGEVTSIVEGSQPSYMPMYATAELRAKDAQMPIEPGSEQVTAVVTVTFALGG